VRLDKTFLEGMLDNGTLIFAVILGLIDLSEMARNALQFRRGDMPPASVENDAGVGRVEMISVPVYTSSEYEGEIGTEFRVWCENESPLPDWWSPEEATIVWVDSEAATDVSVESVQVGDMVERVEEESPSNVVPVRDIGSPDPFWNELLWDSRGASAERWEIEECIRELMLEAGGESEEDIREHAAVYCKRLLYTQTVGGYDDWGTTLHEVVHSHGFLETYPFIWDLTLS
jgi:hypothetical protein